MGLDISAIDALQEGAEDQAPPLVDDPDADGTDDDLDDEVVAESPKNDAPDPEEDAAEIPVPA